MEDAEFIGGWATTYDGRRVPVSRKDADASMKSFKAADARRRAAMPDSLAALATLHDAWTRLKDEGWRDGIYCPKDGAEFAVIQCGSTGIFSAYYSGDWPCGHLHVADCIIDPSGVLWKAIDALTEGERSRLQGCVEAARQMIEADTYAALVAAASR